MRRPELQLVTRVALAIGKLPWELDELTSSQLTWLQAADACGLIPDPYAVGWRIDSAVGMKEVKERNFKPAPVYMTEKQRDQQVSRAIVSQAKRIGKAGELI